MGFVRRSAIISGIFSLIIITLTIACQPEPIGIPTPTPTPWPVDQLYGYLHEDKESNPTRSDDWVDQKQVWRFTGKISKIEDNRIQFHIETRLGQKDDYVECRFKTKDYVLNLNRNQTVNVLGKLDKVSNAVKFKDCEFLR